MIPSRPPSVAPDPLLATRRAFVAGAAGALMGLAPAAARADTATLAFRLERAGATIGTARLGFAGGAGSLTVDVAVDIAVRIGPIVAYRYTQRTREVWRDGRLVDLASRGDNDGDAFAVTAERSGGVLRVAGPGGTITAPPGTIPSTYWNRRTVEARRILNVVDGTLLDVRVGRVGDATVRTDAGAAIPATRWRVSGDLDIDLWYDRRGTWVGLSFDGRGETVGYVLTSGGRSAVAQLTGPVADAGG